MHPLSSLSGRPSSEPFARSVLLRLVPARSAWLARLLRRHGHSVSVDESGRELAFSMTGVDLVLVEVDQTPESLEFCRLIRDECNVALIAISGEDTEAERLRVLGAGCDEHLSWQCGAAEVMARIDAVLRWGRPTASPQRVIDHGPLRIDPATREVSLHGEPVHLARKEYELLTVLASQAGQVVKRSEVLEALWGDDSMVASRSLDTHVSSLRRKLGRWVCVTVRGFGLRIGTPADAGEAS